MINMVQCALRTAPVNGAVTPTGAVSYPNGATFTCNSGYVLNGVATPTCQADGAWSNPDPVCTPIAAIQCPTLTPPTNGALSTGATSYQTVVTFTCNSGYVLNGAVATTCQADGTWSNPVPTCTPILCLPLTPPANGALSTTDRTYQTVVGFTCKPGYVRNGAVTTTCQADRTWSSPVPTCTPVQCPARTAPANGAVSPTGPISYTNGVTFTCNSGYVLNGQATPTCQADGTWSHPVPVCTPIIAIQCPALTAPANGAASTTATSYLTMITFICYPGYVLNGASVTTCQADGTWSSPVPTCTLPCPVPVPPANGAVSGLIYPNTVTYTCNPGFQFDGVATSTCQADGTWTSPVPKCTPRPCPTLSAPSNGALSPLGPHAYPNLVIFTCNPGYELNGAADTTCQANGTWSHPAPTCTISSSLGVSPCENLTVFNSDSGSFASPSWPGHYPPSTNCTWQINVSPGKVVLLRFGDFDVEHGGRTCIWDSLRIHDGPNISAPVIATLCGSSVGPVITAGSSAFVVFHSDESVTDSGFAASFSAWNDTFTWNTTTQNVTVTTPPTSGQCGNLTVLGGYYDRFTSPGYPGNYPNNAYCSWQISVSTGYVVAIRFRAFSLEDETNCGYDSLAVYDGSSTAAPRLARLCGSSARTIFTTGRNAFVVFRSDGSVTESGFFAYFYAETRTWYSTAAQKSSFAVTTPTPGQCGNPTVLSGNFGRFTSPGYPGNYPNSAYCSWQISVRTGYVVAIRFSAFSLEDETNCGYDSLVVYDGSSPAAPHLARLCGSSPRTIFTTGRNAFVVFRTDGSVTRSGFSANFTADTRT
ncbi:sushi, von Willebrand factor type A, EGF and pentraxin domain-containing protein 1-like [Branchiostoma floridae x Branchiostoma belcheri]